MLRHEIGRDRGAELREDEEAELLVQRARLQHVERLRQAALAAYQALMGGEDDEADERPAPSTCSARRWRPARMVAGSIRRWSTEGEALNAALIQAEESARALRDYLDAVEADPQALETTAERLFLIGDLKRKYGESIREILAYAADARRRLAEIEHRVRTPGRASVARGAAAG